MGGVQRATLFVTAVPLLALLLTILFVGVGAEAQSNISETELAYIPLGGFVDSGYELAPGYRTKVTVIAEGCVPCGGLADAGVMIDSILFGVGQEGRDVYVYMDGIKTQIDSLGLTKKSYSVTFTFTVYCPGEPLPGRQAPPEGYVWMVVEASGAWSGSGAFMVNASNLDILEFTEGNFIVESKIIYGESDKIEDCGAQGGYDLPPRGGGTSGEPEPESDPLGDPIMLAVYGGLALAAAAVLVVALRR